MKFGSKNARDKTFQMNGISVSIVGSRIECVFDCLLVCSFVRMLSILSIKQTNKFANIQRTAFYWISCILDLAHGDFPSHNMLKQKQKQKHTRKQAGVSIAGCANTECELM